MTKERKTAIWSHGSYRHRAWAIFLANRCSPLLGSFSPSPGLLNYGYYTSGEGCRRPNQRQWAMRSPVATHRPSSSTGQCHAPSFWVPMFWDPQKSFLSRAPPYLAIGGDWPLSCWREGDIELLREDELEAFKSNMNWPHGQFLLAHFFYNGRKLTIRPLIKRVKCSICPYF